jgi:hypothetical protein
MTFAQIQPQNTPARGLLMRLVEFLFPSPKPVIPTELQRAIAMRDAARARYQDACERSDTRDQHVYLAQFMRATNRVLRIEMGGRA